MADRTRRLRIVRLVAGYVAIAAAIPYLTLKILWIAGNPIGFNDKALVTAPLMVGGNVLTACLDAVAVVVALAFTYRWGRRVPAWLVLLPMWVGTGLLTPIALDVPVVAAHSLLTGTRVVDASGPVAPWVYKMVYTGFTVEAAALLTAFVLYAYDRWGVLLRTRLADGAAGATEAVQRLVATGAALLAGAVGALHLFWAAGGTVGLPAGYGHGFAGRFLDGVYGLLTLAGVVGMVWMVYRLRGRTPLWVPFGLAWLGAGSTFGFGLWHMFLVLGHALPGAGTGGLLPVHAFAKVLAGLLLGTVGAFLLAERDASALLVERGAPVAAGSGPGR